MAQNDIYDDPITGETFRETETGELVPVNPAAAELTGPEANLVSMGAGVSNLIGGVTDMIRQARGQPEQPREDYMGDVRAMYPMQAMMGEMTPGLVPIPGGLPAQMLYGASYGAASSDRENRAAGAGLGAALAGAGDATGRVLSRVLGGGVRTTERGVRQLRSSGMGRGKSMMQTLENQLEDTTLGGLTIRGTTAKNRDLLTSRAAASIGEQADNLSPEVFDRAYSRLGQVYDQVESALSSARIRPTQDFLDDVADIMPTKIKRRVKTSGDVLDGELLGLIRSEATAKMKDPVLYNQARDILDEYLDMIHVNAGSDMVDELLAANRQYRKLMVLSEPSVTNPQGQVNAKTLWNRLSSRKQAGRRGRDELQALAAEVFEEATTLSNSGTGGRLGNVLDPRQLMAPMLIEPGAGSALGAAAGRGLLAPAQEYLY